jgi:hypothetical protein
MLDARTIARALGGDVTSRDSCNAPGPGHGQGDRSLSIKINPRAPAGFVVFSHAGDDPIECRDYVRSRLGMEAFRPGSRYQPSHRVPFTVIDNDADRRVEYALKLWQQSVNPVGTIVERYLLDHRALNLLPDFARTAIRFHGSLRYDDQRLPGMVCLFRDIVTNEPVGIHRTFLDPATARKLDRRMLGTAKGAAIKVDAQGAINDRLTIGEGVETVLSARALGLGPVWALGSSGAIRAFPVIKRFTEITILQENDATSRRDTTYCAKQYQRAGKPVNLVKPHVGNDFNDVWRHGLAVPG